MFYNVLCNYKLNHMVINIKLMMMTQIKKRLENITNKVNKIWV